MPKLTTKPDRRWLRRWRFPNDFENQRVKDGTACQLHNAHSIDIARLRRWGARQAGHEGRLTWSRRGAAASIGYRMERGGLRLQYRCTPRGGRPRKRQRVHPNRDDGHGLWRLSALVLLPLLRPALPSDLRRLALSLPLMLARVVRVPVRERADADFRDALAHSSESGGARRPGVAVQPRRPLSAQATANALAYLSSPQSS